MKKILVVGCAGTLGSFIGEELSNLDYKLYGTYNRFIPLNPANYEKLYRIDLADLRQLSKLNRIIKDIDIVIFTVGNTNFSNDHNKLYNANFVSLKNFVDYLQNIKVNKQIVFCSSTSVYSGVKNYVVSEKTERIPMNIYGVAKIEAENYLMNSGLDYVILRFPIMYGPSFAFKFTRMFEAAKSQSIKIFGTGKNRIPFVYEEDIIAVILRLLKNNVHKEDFIISSRSVTQETYWKSVCNILNAKPPQKIAIKKAHKIAEEQMILYKKYKIQPRLLKEDINTFSRNRTYDCSKLMKKLHLTPMNNFSTVIKRTFVAKDRILRENANKLLLYIYPKRTLPFQILHSYKDINLNYFKKYPHLKVWAVSVKNNDQVPSVSTLFSRKLDNIIHEIKKYGKNHYFMLRKSPAKADILCHGSFLIDKKNFGEKTIITISMQNKQEDKLSKTRKGIKFKMLPRDFNTDLSVELKNDKILSQNNTLIFEKVEPAIKILMQDMKKLVNHLIKCNKQDLIVPCLFIITKKNKVHYVAMGM